LNLRFTSPLAKNPGTIAAILKACYASLISSDPEFWGNEAEGWDRFDAHVYEDAASIGECTFLSWHGSELVGFASYDPRQWPALGIIGHNGILPEFQRRGFGKQQIAEILQRFRKIGFKIAKVSTLGHPFFIPAQKMYLGCGFFVKRWIPWEECPRYRLIEYEQDLM
jgi:GNAT superfamily N-acetyltransferase